MDEGGKPGRVEGCLETGKGGPADDRFRVGRKEGLLFEARVGGGDEERRGARAEKGVEASHSGVDQDCIRGGCGSEGFQAAEAEKRYAPAKGESLGERGSDADSCVGAGAAAGGDGLWPEGVLGEEGLNRKGERFREFGAAWQGAEGDFLSALRQDEASLF